MSAPATESRVAVANSSLYVRVAGRGRPLIVLHGGPDFDTAYLLPELDRLTEKWIEDHERQAEASRKHGRTRHS